jgi:hypothetical protein
MGGIVELVGDIGAAFDHQWFRESIQTQAIDGEIMRGAR